MNKKDYMRVIIILAVFITLIVLLVLKLTGSSENNNNKYNINKEITRLTNESVFFRIQNAIQNEVSGKSYIAIKIYYNDDELIKYYFVEGYSFDLDFGDTYDKNDDYLIIVKNGKYNIEKIDAGSDIEEYAKNYDIQNIQVDGNNLPSYNTNEKNKLIGYLASYKNLLMFDPEKAYEMLDASVKEKYYNYFDFKAKLNEVNNIISTNIVSYSKSDNTYSIKNKKGYSIKLIEEYPNDFKISF